jgi:hypothetical protein
LGKAALQQEKQQYVFQHDHQPDGLNSFPSIFMESIFSGDGGEFSTQGTMLADPTCSSLKPVE